MAVTDPMQFHSESPEMKWIQSDSCGSISWKGAVLVFVLAHNDIWPNKDVAVCGGL